MPFRWQPFVLAVSLFVLLYVHHVPAQEANPPGPTKDAKVVMDVHTYWDQLTTSPPGQRPLIQLNGAKGPTEAEEQLRIIVDQLRYYAQQYATSEERANVQQNNSSFYTVQNGNLAREVTKLTAANQALEAKVKEFESKGKEAKPKQD